MKVSYPVRVYVIEDRFLPDEYFDRAKGFYTAMSKSLIFRIASRQLEVAAEKDTPRSSSRLVETYEEAASEMYSQLMSCQMQLFLLDLVFKARLHPASIREFIEAMCLEIEE